MTFPIAGKRAVVEALTAGRYRKAKLFLARDAAQDQTVAQCVNQAERQKIPMKTVSLPEMDHLVSGPHSHQGIVLLLDEPPPLRSLEQVVSDISQRSWSLIAVIDGALDHQNIGAIVRSAALFGVSALVAPQDRSAPLVHPAVWRIAQGAAEHVSLVSVVNLAQALARLKDQGFWIAGAHTPDNEQSQPSLTDDPKWPAKLAVVFGSESKGLRPLTAKLCDFVWMLPQEHPGGLDSLNLSAAAAICFWENYRRVRSLGAQ